jgi:PAS domain S-box-containing protein
MTTNAILFIAALWVLGGLVLIEHRFSDRIGFAPLLLTIGAFSVFVQSQLGVYLEPTSGLTLYLSSNVLVPIILMTVLVVYICNGALTARIMIFSVIGLSLLVLGIQALYRTMLLLPGGGVFSAVNPQDLYPPLNLRITAASLIAYTCDLFVIAIFYQGARNALPRLPEWIVVGLALLAGVWTDALVFTIISGLGSPSFAVELTSAIMGMLLSALILWPLVAYYIVYQAPRLRGFKGAAGRGTLDLLFGSFDEVKQALVTTQGELEKVEKQRRHEEAYFRQIADNITEALWLMEPQHQHAFYVNTAYTKIWGRSAASFYADPLAFIDSLHPEDKDRILSGLHRQLDDTYEAEYRIVRPDGTIRWVRDRSFPIKNDDGKIYRIAGMTEDITDKMQLERQNLELAVEREKVKLLRDFISEASHDLKSPLASIRLKVYQVRRLADADKRAAQLDELDTAVERMSRMIDDLFTIARLDSIDDMHLVRLQVTDFVRDTCLSLQPVAKEKQLDLVLNLNSDGATIQADEHDMTRVLLNLLENAIRYTSSGGRVVVQTAIVEETDVLIRVSDNGVGIPEEDLPQIFNRFYRATNARNIEPMGTGLGLSIVRKIVDNHHGRIEVGSTPGKGTEFTVYLPIG